MINLTESPEFMAALRRALIVALEGLEIGARVRGEDPENDWLTTQEVLAFLRTSSTGLKRLRKTHAAKLVISYGIHAKVPRFQRAALQQMMRDRVVGAGQPEGEAQTPAPKKARKSAPAPRPVDPAPSPRPIRLPVPTPQAERTDSMGRLGERAPTLGNDAPLRRVRMGELSESGTLF